MQDIIKIIKKIDAPLTFIMRDEYRNLHLVKNFETSIENYMSEIKAAVTVRDENRDALERCLSRMETAVSGFDSLGPAEKKRRVYDLIASLSEIKRIVRGETVVCGSGGTGNSPVSSQEGTMDRSVQYVKGVGPKIAALLQKKSIATVEDMLYFLPRRYEDRRSVVNIADTCPGTFHTVAGRVVDSRVQRYRRRTIFEVTFSDDDDRGTVLEAKWFQGNFRYLTRTFIHGRRFILTGEVKGNLLVREMIHPDYEELTNGDETANDRDAIVPVYSETEGLHQKVLRRIMKSVVEEYGDGVCSPIPVDICRRHGLMDMTEAIRHVHFPPEESDMDRLNRFTSDAHRRLIFDELFFFQLGMALRKRGYAIEEGIAFTPRGSLLERFYATLPFGLTAAQKRVIEEITGDMARTYPMHRLLQGDVGSGKTVVSMVPIIIACENGYQAAFMAPTEILAQQHFTSVETWARPLGLSTVLLTGGVPEKEKRTRMEGIARGDINIVIGTHALIQEEISFHRLGFAVIDEQHRFGVIQRATLREKGTNPDILVMTATPIPRTLSMTVYGDLDVSVIDEMPPGKRPVRTRVFYERDRITAYDAVRREVEKGNQVFIVYPLVEESELLDLKDATSMAHHLEADVFPEFRVGLLHGRMKGEEKERIMMLFQEKAIDILVSTTVIEVGIDIPAATLIVIEHAERFGLSQLHQLRGRVGRNCSDSLCILMTHRGGTNDARRRLRVMEKTNDGFVVAEEDLAIRGPGEFLGTRQSGLPDFRVADIVRDARIVSAAKNEAVHLIETDPSLQRSDHLLLYEILMKKWRDRLSLAKTG